MSENEANIYSIAYRDCKEVSDNIDVNEEFGKASTILFYMDEILEALKIASELQAIGTVEEFKDLKEKNEPKKLTNIHKLLDIIGFCPSCRNRVYYSDGTNYCPTCGQKLYWGNE